MNERNHYSVLGVRAHADFGALRKAYRARAVECHPDLFGGDPEKAEEFKLLSNAFNVLSDPVSRREYDLKLGIAAEVKPPGQTVDMGTAPEDSRAVLDTMADDILEELVVGNTYPRGTSLQTLMLDLEKTDQFCLFREAKTNLYGGSTTKAELLFRRYIRKAPVTILARYYLSKCCVANGKWKDAERQLQTGIRIGSARQPALKLIRMRQELQAVRRKRPGLIGAIRRFLDPPRPIADGLTPEERERHRLNRAINRLAAERLRRPPQPRAHLPPRKRTS